MLEPFKIAIPDDVLKDLGRRLGAARLGSEKEGWEEGTDPAYLRELIDYWRNGYDWRAQEALLNNFHHFRGTVDGAALHLIHEKGRGPAPLPLPKDISTPPCEWAERFYNAQRWTEMPRGGHFAALEEPALLAEDIRAFFRPLRQ